MKNTRKTLDIRFGAEARFDFAPEPVTPFRGTIESELEKLKSRLLKERLAQTEQLDATVPLRRAANEAAALAWLTAYPLLVFPTLFAEKATQTRRQLNKQARVWARSETISAMAV